MSETFIWLCKSSRFAVKISSFVRTMRASFFPPPSPSLGCSSASLRYRVFRAFTQLALKFAAVCEFRRIVEVSAPLLFFRFHSYFRTSLPDGIKIYAAPFCNSSNITAYHFALRYDQRSVEPSYRDSRFTAYFTAVLTRVLPFYCVLISQALISNPRDIVSASVSYPLSAQDTRSKCDTQKKQFR